MGFDNLSGDNIANIIISLFFVTYLLISIVNSKNITLVKLVKYIMIWLFMGLIILIIYSYRYELNDLKIRLASEISPSKPRIINQSNQKSPISINISNDRHFYLEAKINQKNVLFLIDTGASDISLSISDAKKIGIDVDNLKYNKIYQTANGNILGATVILKEIIIADRVFNNISASVNKANQGVSLLGMSMLTKFEKYEFHRNKLILY
jgi:aspartyl protease family protein